MNNLHIVTVATNSEYYFPYLSESCKKHGKNLEVLGYGEVWQGFSWKFKLMIDYLTQLPQNDIVCFIDGYDVICVRNLHDLTDEFIKLKEKHDCLIVIGHDKRSFIMNNIATNLFFGKCKKLDINSGTYIGYVKDLLPILTKTYEYTNNNNDDDQGLITKYCNLNPAQFYIDTKSILFLTFLYPLQEIDSYINIENNEVIYKTQYPFFIHAAGYTFLDNIIIKLGYNYDKHNKIKSQLLQNFLRKKVFMYCYQIYEKSYGNLYVTLSIMLVLFVIVLYLLYYKSKIYKFLTIKNK